MTDTETDLAAILAEEGAEAFIDQRDTPIPMAGVKSLPYGYTMTARGLRYKAQGEDVNALVVLTPFNVLGRITDAAGSNPGTVIAWVDELGRYSETVVPDLLLHSSGGTLPAELAKLGLRCVVAAEKPLKFFFNFLACHTWVTRCDQPGWQPSGAYALPNGQILGASEGSHMLTGKTPDRFQQMGSLADWKTGVAHLAVGNSRLILAVSHSFVGPILRDLEEMFCAIHLEGGSSSGKSSTLEMAGSSWGRPDARDQIRSWRSTDNAIEGAATAANDGLLLLDELGQAPVDSLKDSLYMLANGFGKARANVDGSSRAVRNWRIAMFSTGERSPDDIIKMARRDAPVGLDVRLVSIPADAGVGMGVFENLHGSASPKDFADRLRAAAHRLHGTAGPAFLAWYIARRADPVFLADLRRRVTSLAEAMTPPGADGQIARAMTKAAVTAIAGELAIEAGVLPWQKGAAELGVRRCMTAWLARRGSLRPREEADVLRALSRFISAHGGTRFEDTSPLAISVRDRAGWVCPDGVYWVTGPAFSEIVAPASKKFAAELLLREGYAEQAGSIRASINGLRVRVYAIKPKIMAFTDEPVDHVAEARVDAEAEDPAPASPAVDPKPCLNGINRARDEHMARVQAKRLRENPSQDDIL